VCAIRSTKAPSLMSVRLAILTVLREASVFQFFG
jgi:hypothetical protein